MHGRSLLLTLENLKELPQPQRLELVNQFLANLHPDTEEDFRWGAEHLGMSFYDCVGLFVEAKKLYLVRDPDKQPLYMIAFGDTGYLSTLCAKHLDQHRLSMTKLCIRYSKSEEGIRELQGTYGAADEQDLKDGKLTFLWVYGMGYDYCDKVQLDTGPIIHRFAFNRPLPDQDLIGEDHVWDLSLIHI